MNNEYKFYIKVIKPLEKKYNKLSILCCVFKFKFLKEKLQSYNNQLLIYYMMINKNHNYLRNLAKQLKKKSNN